MDIARFPQINPPQRLLMGPGPINADPRVLRALRHAPGHALSADAVCPEWPDPDQRARAIASP